MFEDAAADFGLRLAETAMIGDQPSDIEAARHIGALGVLVAGEASGEAGACYAARDRGRGAVARRAAASCLRRRYRQTSFS